MDELKPCPFCQSRAEHYSFNYRKHTVRCRYCLADCGEHDNPERAAFVWNTRPAEEAVKAEVGRLKDRVERLELLLFKIQETSTPHIGSVALYQAELKAINRWCKLALGKGNNPDTEKGREDE